MKTRPTCTITAAARSLKSSYRVFALALLLGLPAPLQAEVGTASWYSKNDPGVNRRTANGEIFDDKKLTCATRSYTFGTRLRIKNLKNGKCVECRVNDRGPHKRLRHRKIDLTKSAFQRIEDAKHGLARVSICKISD